MTVGMQHLGTTKKGTATATAAAPTTSSVLVVAANPKRISVTIYNHSTTITCFLGGVTGVLAADGFPILPGDSVYDNDSKGAIYAITASGTGDLRAWQVV